MNNKVLKIKKDTKYQIITDSPTFQEKYGKENLFIIIEDRDFVVFGDNWHKKTNVPAVVAFMFRQMKDRLADFAQAKCYYGKVYTAERYLGLGELVFDYELKSVN